MGFALRCVRWAVVLAIVAVLVAVLSILTLEPLALADDDLAGIRFLTVAPAAQTKKPEEPAEEGARAWYEAEAREWRGVVRQVKRAFSSAAADFWFRFPARPSAPAQKRLYVHSGLPRPNEVRRCGNTIVLYLGGGATRNRTWSRLLGGMTLGVEGALRCAWRARLPCPIVGFNMPTNRAASFNCGQTDDCRVLSHVYRRIHTRYPGAKIVVVASCLGALRVVNWLASLAAIHDATGRKLGGLAGLALESPLPSLAEYPGLIADHPRVQQTLYALLRASLPNYSSQLDPLHEKLAPGPLVAPEVPVLVSLLASDPVSTVDGLRTLLARLPHAHVLISQRTRVNSRIGRGRVAHGRMILLPEHQAALRTLVRDVAQTTTKRASRRIAT